MRASSRNRVAIEAGEAAVTRMAGEAGVGALAGSVGNPADQVGATNRAAAATLEWLLDPALPAVRRIALRDVLGRPREDPSLVDATAALATDPWVTALLPPVLRPNGAPLHPYVKWRGAHWRLVALAELTGGLPTASAPIRDAAVEALEADLRWLLGATRHARLREIDGRMRACGSQEGNALFAASRMGLAAAPGVETLARRLVAWQWPDGGWNCDVRPTAAHSSLHETLPALRGLVAWAHATGDPDARETAGRAAELLLRHRVVFSERTGAPIDPAMLSIRWPAYWHCDVLAALRALAEAGAGGDPRASAALDLLEAKRRPDGRWSVDGRWWRAPGASSANVEVVAWETGPSRMATVAAMLVLEAAGRASGARQSLA